MNLTGIYTSKISADISLPGQLVAAASKSNDKGFSDLLNKAEKSARQKPDESYEQVKKPKEKPVAKDKLGAEADEAPVEDAQQAEGTDNAKEAEKTDGTQELQDGKPVEEQGEHEPSEAATLPDAEKIAAEALAVTLGVDAELVLQVLTALNIKTVDFAYKVKLNEFLMQVYEASEPAELLSVPNIKEKMVAVRELVSEIKVDTEPARVTQQVHRHLQTAAAATEAQPMDTAGAVTDINAQLITSSADAEAEAPAAKPAVLNSNVATAEMYGSQDTVKLSAAKEQQPGDVLHFIPVTNVPATSTAAVSKAAEAFASVDTADIINQITEVMKYEVRGNLTELKINLKPEHLGDVSLKVAIENGIITAQFVAESQRVKEIIEASFNQLKDVLQQQGIQVSQLSVSVGQDDSERRMEQFLREQRRAGQRLAMIRGITVPEQETVDAANIDQARLYDNNINYAI